MQLVILAGGVGSRVSSITDNKIPKALMLVEGKTILEHQIIRLPKGFSVLILIGGSTFRSEFSQEVKILRAKYNLEINVIEEGENLGTAGALSAARKYLEKSFLVIMGDILFSANLKSVWNAMHGIRVDVGIVVRKTDHPRDSDLVRVNQYGQVVRIYKYPHNEIQDYNNSYGLTGIFYFRKRIFSNQPNFKKVDLTNYIIQMQNSGRRLFSFQVSGIVKDIGTVERFATAAETLKDIDRYLCNSNKKLVIVDKDDTIIRDQDPRTPIVVKDLNSRLISKIVKRHGADTVLIVSNQPGIAKGFFSETAVVSQMNSLVCLLKESNLVIAEVLYCPHHPETGHHGEIRSLKIVCECRKPRTGLINEYLRREKLVFVDTVVYGDSFRDKLLARNLGATYIYSSVYLGLYRVYHRLREYYRYSRAVKCFEESLNPE